MKLVEKLHLGGVLLLTTGLDQTLYQSALRPMFGDVGFFSVHVPLGTLLLLPLLFSLLRRPTKRQKLSSQFIWTLLMFAVALLPGMFLAQDRVLHVLAMLQLVFAVLYLWVLISSEVSRTTAKWGILLGACATAFLTFLQVIFQHGIGLGVLGESTLVDGGLGLAKGLFGVGSMLRGYALFPHPNIAFAWIAVAFLLVVSPQKLRNFWHHPQHALLLAALLLGIVATGSKSILFLMLALLAGFLVTRFTPKQTLSMLIVPVASLLLWTYFSLQESSSIADRVVFLEEAWNIMRSHPFGVGLANMPAYLAQTTGTPPWMAQPVHNVFALLFVELGVFGGLVGLYAFCGSLKNAFLRSSRQHARTTALVTFVLLTMMVDHYWITNPSMQLLLVMVVAIVLRPVLARKTA